MTAQLTEWRIRVTLREVRGPDARVPRVIEVTGTPPPQYPSAEHLPGDLW